MVVNARQDGTTDIVKYFSCNRAQEPTAEPPMALGGHHDQVRALMLRHPVNHQGGLAIFYSCSRFKARKVSARKLLQTEFSLFAKLLESIGVGNGSWFKIVTALESRRDYVGRSKLKGIQDRYACVEPVGHLRDKGSHRHGGV